MNLIDLTTACQDHFIRTSRWPLENIGQLLAETIGTMNADGDPTANGDTVKIGSRRREFLVIVEDEIFSNH
jgi:hypothetical protein